MKTTFLSQIAAEQLREPSNIISITDDADRAEFSVEHKRILRLQFDDVDGYVGSDGLTVFSLDQARRIHEFVNECYGEDIVVHCHAGMSRSAAVAKFIADKREYRLDMRAPCIGTSAYYNRHVYKTLNALYGDSLAAYYADVEQQQRMNGGW